MHCQSPIHELSAPCYTHFFYPCNAHLFYEEKSDNLVSSILNHPIGDWLLKQADLTSTEKQELLTKLRLELIDLEQQIESIHERCALVQLDQQAVGRVSLYQSE